MAEPVTALERRGARHRWKRIAVINAMNTVLAFSVSGGMTAPTWPRFIRMLAISAIYVNVIGTAMAVVTPRLTARYGGSGKTVRHVIRLATVLTVLAGG